MTQEYKKKHKEIKYSLSTSHTQTRLLHAKLVILKMVTSQDTPRRKTDVSR